LELLSIIGFSVAGKGLNLIWCPFLRILTAQGEIRFRRNR
jgi:hypothetical protein